MNQLEKIEKIREKTGVTYEESEDSDAFQQASQPYEAASKETFGDQVKKFVKWCGKLVKKGCENFFIISKGCEELATLPVLVMVLLLLLAFWLTVPGLSIAKWIVDAHGGHIEILTRPEFGTRVTVRL